MKMLRHLFLSSIILAGWMPFSAAQTNPNLEIGIKPFGSYAETAFDSISNTNGNLTLHIPLFNYPQRGDAQAKVKIVYNNKLWLVAEDCKHPDGSCTERWAYRAGSFIRLQLDDGIVGVDIKYVNTNIPVFTVYSSDGAAHPIDGGQSTDGTGIRYNMYNPASPGSPILLDRRGAGFNSSKTVWNDRNGNYLDSNYQFGNSQSQNGPGARTDTLGRTLGGTITDSSGTSGCSSGPLSPTGSQVFKFPGPNGGNRLVKLCLVSVHLKTDFQATNYGSDGTEHSIAEKTAIATDVIQSIIVFNDASWNTSPQWTFEYGSPDPAAVNYGDLTKVTLPAGGTISYGWTTNAVCNDAAITPVSRSVSTRAVDANNGMGPQTTTFGPTETDPAGNQTKHTITRLGGSCSLYETQTDYFQGSTLVKTVMTDYTWGAQDILHNLLDPTPAVAHVFPIRVTTKLPIPGTSDFLVTKVETDYNATYGMLLEKREYAYGTNSPGALLRKTTYTCKALTDNNYLNANLLDLVSQVTVTNGSGQIIAQRKYFYDATTLQNSGITNHHLTTLPNPGVRGNLTSVQDWLNTTSTWLTTSQTTLYDTGQAYISKDLKLNQTQYTYDPTYVGAYVTQTQFPDTSGVHHIVSGTYDFNTGLLTSFTDQNSRVSSYGYDVLGRMTTASLPDGGSVGFSYTDSVPFQIQKTVAITGSLNKITNTIFDGLGRVSQTQFHDPDCTTGSALVKVDSNYGNDTLQHTHYTTVTTPYCDTPGTVYGLPSRTDSDALGRVVKLTQTDGSTVTSTYAPNSTALAQCSIVTDEAGKARKSCSDGLGRLVRVWEDPNTLNYETDYDYDGLDNLVSVNQKGDNSAPRTRSFIYDSFSRLTSATNPESGTLTYTYPTSSGGCAGDAGTLCTKTAPKPNQTGTATVVTTYSYDALNRLTQKSYSDGSTATVKYGYDAVVLTGCTTAPPSLADSNPAGQRTAMCDGSGATSWNHDTMGRTLTEKRTIQASSAVTNSVGYTYNLDGSPAAIAYPSGRTITYTPSAAARMLSAIDQNGTPSNTADDINYVTGATYAPQGALYQFKNGASISGAMTYNSRLQPRQLYFTKGTISSGTLTQLQQAACPTTPATIMSRSDYFGEGTNDNGNVASIANCRDTNRSQNFDYDALNRIKDAYATGTNWGETFTIDPWGNLTNIGSYTGKTGHETLNAAPATTKNQLTGFGYDIAGNLTSNGTFSYVYNGENQLKSLTQSGTTTSYVYDGDGSRLIKCAGTFPTCASGTLYWKGGGSDTLTETNLSGTATADYVFFNGKRVARRDLPGGAVHYYFSDHLGSASVITNAAGGTTQEESDYYPYGGEIPIVNNDPNQYKFTGKERDSESGLDMFGARYYGSSLGRFMTPDWSSSPDPVPYGDLNNPQTLNLYSYVKNNPTTLTDADGHCWSWVQGFCNVFQRVFYEFFTDYGFKNYAQVTQIRRNWLLEHVRTEQDAKKVDKLTPREVNQYYNCLNNSGCAQKLYAFAAAARLTAGQARDLARYLGFREVKVDWDTHGQPVFEKDGRYVSPDADGHSGGTWKEFDRRGNRIATLDHNLNPIGK